MNVLVTGGAGFIGGHLVEELLFRSHRVTVLDDLSTGKLSNLTKADSLTFVQGSITDPGKLAEALRGIEAVVHLAAVASVQASVDDPVSTNHTNLVGTIKLLEAAAEAEVQRFVFAGSAAVYGDQNLSAGEAVPEDAPLKPQSPYAIDKLAGEQYLAYYHAAGRLSGTSFRFFNIYGPRQDPSSPYSGVISVFHDRLSAGMPITIFGDGEQTRDFLYVGDLAKLLANRLEQPGARSETLPVVNVGSGQATSLLELVDKLGRILQTEPDIHYASAREGDIKHSLANIARLKQLAPDFTPVTLEAGLQLLADQHT